MAKFWKTPLYPLTSKSGKKISVDVTTSVSASLPANQVLAQAIIPLFKKRKVKTVLDFGAGALRHTMPLLNAGFEVCAVEFKETFNRAVPGTALATARKHPNFCSLIWPYDFAKDSGKFDAVLLCYVLQVMPVPDERSQVLKYVHKKLKADGYLLYMSRLGQLDDVDDTCRVNDGWYKYPDREHHSFYREFDTPRTHAMMEDYKFRRLRSLSKRGTDQIFLYGKGGAVFV